VTKSSRLCPRSSNSSTLFDASTREAVRVDPVGDAKESEELHTLIAVVTAKVIGHVTESNRADTPCGSPYDIEPGHSPRPRVAFEQVARKPDRRALRGPVWDR